MYESHVSSSESSYSSTATVSVERLQEFAHHAAAAAGAPEERTSIVRVLEQALTGAASIMWPLVAKLNQVIPSRELYPEWAPAPLIGKADRTFPPLGWPRETDSLCPECVREVRKELLSGELDLDTLVAKNPGEIKAQIIEENGQVLMRKTCAKHGLTEDILSMDPAFMKRIESLFPGRDFLSPVTQLRQHGSSSIQYGRGAVLTVDLTNRCNMMCDPCFMDANQVGYVHELTLDEVKSILNDSITIKPKRQMSVQFSGGEPTLSPHFLDSIRYAREIGYFCVQCASNGVRFAQDPEFAKEAKEAGLRLVYLQFDGMSNEANSHRKVGNLFDVKLRAIEHLHAVGIDVVLVVTIVNGVNQDEIGPIVRFAIDNADKITVVSFQPVSFTGRDEDISEQRRKAQRYTLSHLAHDVKKQLGVTEPLRDWFPLSSMGPFADITDRIHEGKTNWGSLKCGCHPNCGIGTILFVNKKTQQMIPLTAFLDVEQLMWDVQSIADAAKGRSVTVAELVVALLKNFKADKAPPGYGFFDLVRQFLSQTGASASHIGEKEGDAKEFTWRLLFVAGMWFQDLFNYDFRRTEMCIIPYGTQLGEISFCAYNTGVGWRNIIEKMKANMSVAEWNRTHGRHAVYAKNQELPLPPSRGSIRLGSTNEPRTKTRLRIID